jgi:hypothetical protein
MAPPVVRRWSGHDLDQIVAYRQWARHVIEQDVGWPGGRHHLSIGAEWHRLLKLATSTDVPNPEAAAQIRLQGPEPSLTLQP